MHLSGVRREYEMALPQNRRRNKADIGKNVVKENEFGLCLVDFTNYALFQCGAH